MSPDCFFEKSHLAACLETWLQLKVEPYRAVAKFHFSVGLYYDQGYDDWTSSFENDGYHYFYFADDGDYDEGAMVKMRFQYKPYAANEAFGSANVCWCL